MMYVEFTAANKTYKLRLNTRNTVMLEKQLGCNPLAIFGNGAEDVEMPKVTTMVQILYCALLQYNHGISLDDAYTIFDEYLADGNSATDFLMVIVELFKVSGLIKADKVTEKNA